MFMFNGKGVGMEDGGVFLLMGLILSLKDKEASQREQGFVGGILCPPLVEDNEILILIQLLR